MKLKSLSKLLVLLLPLVTAVAGWAYVSTDNIIASRTFNTNSASLGADIVITSSFINAELSTLRGFYYSENIPVGLTVATQSVTIDGVAIFNYTLETGSVGDIYPSTVPYRWILETPVTFIENNPVSPSSTAEIIFAVNSAQAGTYYFKHFSWAGYFPATTLGSFGYSDTTDHVTVQYSSSNNPPVASGQSVTTPEDIALAIVLSASDLDGDQLTYSVIDMPLHGTLSGTPPNLSFTPDLNFFGADSFTFQAYDSKSTSNTATVSITVTSVNDAPTAGDDSFSVNEDVALTVPVTSGVLVNDNDVEGTSLTAVLQSNVANGVLTLNSTGSFDYTPSPDFNGTDSFTYMANDGNLNSSPATVTLTVNPINDPPTINGTPPASVYEDNSYSFTPTAADVDGDNLSFTIQNQPVWATFDSTTGTLSGTPVNANVGATYGIIISVTDGQQTSSLPSFDLTVVNTNDAPTSATAVITTLEDVISSSVIPSVNDPDVGDGHTFSIATQPSHGTASVTGNQITYDPSLNYFGSDSFTFLATDSGGLSVVGTANVTVTPVNDPPSISGTPATTIYTGDFYSFIPSINDIDGDSLSLAIQNTPGWATFDTTTGTLSGTPVYADGGTTYQGISISVSDGEYSDTLLSFDITVLILANRHNISKTIRDLKAGQFTEQEVMDLINAYMQNL